MKRLGKITRWKDDQGFGFITPKGGGKEIFVHIKAFSNRRRRPVDNEIVTYETGVDKLGRTRAERVEFIGDTRARAKEWNASLPVFILFVAFLIILIVMGYVPFFMLGVYLVASLITFLVYVHDKNAAQNNQWRTPEISLHILGLAGGWPGAFIAQRARHHKVKKQSFQIAFWVTVVLNFVLLLNLFK